MGAAQSALTLSIGKKWPDIEQMVNFMAKNELLGKSQLLL
jgi:hypothetical protein